MNNDEAKFILIAYRPSGEDSSDAQMKAALDLTQRNPGLDAWLKLEIERDTKIAAALQSAPVPPSLRNEILAGAKISAFSGKARRFWFTWLPLSAAALLMASAVTWFLTENERLHSSRYTATPLPLPPELAGWQKVALSTLESGKMQFNAASPKPQVLADWLKNHGSPGNLALAKSRLNLTKLASLGCTVLTVDGQRVSIVCFQLPGGEGEVHLAMTNRQGQPGAPSTEQPPAFVQHGNWATAQWCEGEQWVMVASTIAEAKLKQLIL